MTTSPPETHHRSYLPTIGAILVLTAAVLATVVVLPSGSTPVGGYATALEACAARTSVEKASQTRHFDWHLAVEEDRVEGSALLLVSGTDELLCLTNRGTDGRYLSATSGLGGFADATPVLTYDAGLEAPAGATNRVLQLVVGRIPTGAAAVVVTTSDGTPQRAAVANGHYLGWLTTGAAPVQIAALDATGRQIASIADPHGLIAPR